MTVLSANHIYKSFGEKQVLNDVSVCLNDGELVSLLGVSGGGKTTLFNVLSGIYLPDSGEVYLKDENVTGKPGKVSYMLQKDLLLPYKKVIDNVSLPLLINGKSKKEARETAGAYFEIFGLDGTQEMYPDALSGGMRQRAALLRTYLASEGVALLDEPFSALDTITKSRMHKWYLEIMKEINLSTLFITHDIDEAILLSDRIYILNGGRITQETVIDSAEKRNPDFNLTGEFLEYKKKIKSFLE
ncbi:MAG: ABC transporter ATP-binding protein [Clostridia bacterium]|nr:ABC transporter ATP-binding protein [Clostridia bacterium]